MERMTEKGERALARSARWAADEDSDGEDSKLQPDIGGGSSAGVDGLMEDEATAVEKRQKKKSRQTLLKNGSVSLGLKVLQWLLHDILPHDPELYVSDLRTCRSGHTWLQF